MKNFFYSILVYLISVPAFAEEAAASGGHSNVFLAPLGAGLVLGLAALGGTLAQGKVGASAMDGIARNPQAQGTMFMPMIVVLALVESLVILSFLIAFQLIGILKG